MGSINLLIGFALFCAYCLVGSGIYMLILWHDKEEWKDSEAGIVMIAWPFVLIVLLPWILVGFFKWFWTMTIALTLTIFGKEKTDDADS